MKQLTGYLATLDVLGFSELLYRDGYSQKLRQYLDCINDVVRPSHVKAECVVFSDSVVLTSPGETAEAFSGLIKACSAAFNALVMCEIPVRGAIAFGRYWREASRGSVFLAGRPIVEAYRRERGQITLCPSVLHTQTTLAVETHVPDNDEAPYDTERSLTLALRLQPGTVPYQDSNTSETGKLSGYAVVPIQDDDDNFRTASRAVHRVRGSLEDLRLKASEPAAQAKYSASLRWLEEVEERFEKVPKRGNIWLRKAGYSPARSGSS